MMKITSLFYNLGGAKKRGQKKVLFVSNFTLKVMLLLSNRIHIVKCFRLSYK